MFIEPQVTAYVGAGGFGCNLGNYMFQSPVIKLAEHPVLATLMNTDSQHLDSIMPENSSDPMIKAAYVGGKVKKVLIGKDGEGAGGDWKRGRDLFVAQKLDMEAILKPCGRQKPVNALFVGGGLGGGSIGMLIPIIKAAQSKHIPTLCIVTKPRIDQGDKIDRAAKEMMAELIRLKVTKLVIDNNGVPDLSVQPWEAYETINLECMQPVLFFLKALIMRTGYQNRDMADLRRLLGEGQDAYIGFAKFPRGSEKDGEADPADFKKSAEQLLTSPYLDVTIIKRSHARIFLSCGMSLKDRGELIALTKPGKLQQGLELENQEGLFKPEGDEVPWMGAMFIAKSEAELAEANAAVSDQPVQAQVQVQAPVAATRETIALDKEHGGELCYIRDAKTGKQHEKYLTKKHAARWRLITLPVNVTNAAKVESVSVEEAKWLRDAVIAEFGFEPELSNGYKRLQATH